MQKLYFKTTIIALLISVQALAALFAWWMLGEIRGDGGIPKGVKINGIPVGGLKPEEAELLLRGKFDAELDKPLIINAAGEEEKVFPGDIEMSIDYAGAITTALALREKTKGPGDFSRNLALLSGMQNIPLKIDFNRHKMREVLERLERRVNTPPQNATLKWENNRRVVIPEINGLHLDIEATLDKFSSLQAPLPNNLEAVVVPWNAQVTAGELTPLKSILSNCSTDLDRSQPNRLTNINLAAKAIDGTLIKPGYIFSFNRQVGERTAANGYQKAPVIDGNRLLEDVGGGVCQVSSTLYNALLLADLEVVERHPHTKTVGYVSPGLDATVVDGQKDLRFRNNRKFPVFITCTVANSAVNIKIWGVMSDNEPRVIVETEVEPVNPETIIRRDGSLPAGKQVVLNEGERGCVAEVYKVIRGTYGESKKLVSRDYYPPVSRVILAGTGETNSLK